MLNYSYLAALYYQNQYQIASQIGFYQATRSQYDTAALFGVISAVVIRIGSAFSTKSHSEQRSK